MARSKTPSDKDAEGSVAHAPEMVSEDLETSTEGVDLSEELEVIDNSEAKKLKTGVKFGTALLLSILAALGGGLLGWMGPKLFDPANAAPADAIRRNSASLNIIDGQVRDSKEALSRLQGELSAVSADVSALTALRSRISSLESTEQARANIDITAERAAALRPLSDRLDIIDTLLTDESAPDANSLALLERLGAIEAELSEIRMAAVVVQEPVIVTYSENGMTMNNDAGKIDQPEDATTYDLVANFPRSEMLAALNAQNANTESPSWLRRMLSKHISVRDTSAADNLTAIDQAQKLTRQGDVSGAIDAIESLNPTLRAAARPWLLEAKKTL